MPRKKKNDLNATLAPILADMEKQIVDAVDAYISDRFAELHSAFASLQMEPPKVARRARKAAAEPRKAAVPRRRKRARSADVMKAVQAALAAQKSAVGIGVLRDATGYTNAQIRRALGELIKSSAVTKKGQRRDTVYRTKGKGKAPAKPKAPVKRKPAKKTAKKTARKTAKKPAKKSAKKPAKKSAK